MALPYPTPTSEAVSAVMRGNRKKDTLPELRLRSALHAAGLRFRKDVRIQTTDLTVRADIVFPRQRVAVFVDGCFWHGCPDHGTRPKKNTAYWGPKLERNRRRDERIDHALTDAGWLPVRVWEHEDPASAVARLGPIITCRRRAGAG